jgi:predicted  nucleic acid-binding Zn-ribbon protein
LRQLEARLEQLSSQQTNLADARVSLDAELTAIKADISWLSEDCFKTPRPVKL